MIHQSDESFLNDAVTTVLRGHAFISLYMNPKYMNQQRWGMLARLINWSRQNEDLLTAPNTQPLRPATWLRDGTPWLSYDAVMPREPYGYAHWTTNRGLVLLRNPWLLAQSYALPIDLPAGTTAHVVSLYPEPQSTGPSLTPGQNLDVTLAPYETVVLKFAPGDIPEEFANAPLAGERTITAAVSRGSHVRQTRHLRNRRQAPVTITRRSSRRPAGPAKSPWISNCGQPRPTRVCVCSYCAKGNRSPKPPGYCAWTSRRFPCDRRARTPVSSPP